MELFDSFCKQLFLLAAEEGRADADALLRGTHRVEREDSNSVGHQLARQLQVVHARVLHGEVKAVGQRSAHIVVIHEIEAVGKQHVLHELSPSAILLNIVEEVITTITSSLHKSSHSVLNAVSSATSERVHQSVAEEVTKLTHTEVLLQRLINPVIELVADAGNTDTLTGIGECL